MERELAAHIVPIRERWEHLDGVRIGWEIVGVECQSLSSNHHNCFWMWLQMSENSLVWIGGVAVLTGIGVLLIWKFEALAILYDIRITDGGIAFRIFFCLTVYVLRFSNIEYVKEVAGGYWFLAAYNFKNRIFRTTFLIQKKKGLFTKKILVTPADPAAFVNALAQKGVPIG